MKFCAYMAKGSSAILLLIIIGFAGCKKEKDTNAPSIHIHAPSEGAVYFYFNQISIGAHITDDKKIDRIEIEITDATNRRYLSANTVYPEGPVSEYELSTTIAHDDLYLESGIYFVRITVSDGENESTAYREIQLFEAPLQLLKTLAIRQNGSFVAADSLNGSTAWPWFNSDHYDEGAYDSRTGELIVCENQIQRISVYDLSDQIPVPLNSFDVLSEATARTKSVDLPLREFYFGMSNGEIIRYSQTGFQLMANNIGETTRQLLITDQWIYSITSPLLFPAQSKINVWNKQTGSFVQSLPVGFEVMGLAVAGTEDEIFIAGNSSSEAIFRKYFRTSNGINDVFSFYETTPILAFGRGDIHDFYAVHESGIAYYVNNMQSYQLNSALSGSQLIYEPFNSRVFLLASDGIHVMDESCSNEISFFAGSYWRDVLFIYNK
jgi:hypothetical protein